MGADIVPSSTPVALLLNVAQSSLDTPSTGHHFSALPLTSESHLHTPALRLVSLHPLLTVDIVFLRVPQIQDGSKWRVFISRTTTIEAVIQSVVNELGLSKALPIGDGNFEYVVDEVWTDGNTESEVLPFFDRNLFCLLVASVPLEISRLPNSALVSRIVESPFTSDPFQSSARRTLRFCIPEDWFRRSTSHHLSLPSLPSHAALNQSGDSEESDQDASTEGEGTAKQQKMTGTTHYLNERPNSVGLVGSLSQGRLSSFFDGWLSSNLVSTSPTRSSTMGFPSDRVVVSEPKLVEHRTGDTHSLDGEYVVSAGEGDGEEPDPAAFERMLVSRFRLVVCLFC